MPTTRPRHMITESDELGAALDLAARRWPSEGRSRLLVRLAETDAAALAADEAARAAAIDETAGALTGVFGRD